MTSDYNKYNLKILSNNYRNLYQFQGNGIYKEYVEGCFKTGKFFRVYPIYNIYYLAVGENTNKLVEIDKVFVEDGDFIDHRRNQKKFIKYVNMLLDKYIQENSNSLPLKQLQS